MIRFASSRWVRNTALTAACLVSMNAFAEGFGTGQIGSLVWQDTNRNGVQDAGEPGIANRDVSLKTCDGKLLAIVPTDANGTFQFDWVTVGSWYLEVPLMDGEAFSAAGAGNAQTDSNVTSVTGNVGRTACFTMADGEINMTIDVGIHKVLPATGSIGRVVWNDANRNGVQDANEAGLKGATVTLFDANGAKVATTTTGADGTFLFPNLAAGCYSATASAGGYTVATTPTKVTNLCLNGVKDEVVNAAFGLATPVAAPPAPHGCTANPRQPHVTLSYPKQHAHYGKEGFYNSSFRFYDANHKPLYDMTYEHMKAEHGHAAATWNSSSGSSWYKHFSSAATAHHKGKVAYVSTVRDGVESGHCRCSDR